MLHPKKPASVVFLRNTYVGEIEWLRVTITFWMVTRNHYAQSEMITIKKLFFCGKFLRMKPLYCQSLPFKCYMQATNICRIFQKHLHWRDWMVTRNHYAQSEMITVKNFFLRNFCESRALHCESSSFKCYIPRNQHLSSFWETLTLARLNGYA